MSSQFFGKDYDWKKFFLYLFYILIVIVVILLFVFNVIRITFYTITDEENTSFLTLQILITETDNIESTIFTLLNSLIMGLYFNLLSLSNNKQKEWVKIVIIIAIIVIVLLDFNSISFRFSTNWDLFIFKHYCSDSIDGILFFSENIVLFSSIYFLSFLLESERE